MSFTRSRSRARALGREAHSARSTPRLHTARSGNETSLKRLIALVLIAAQLVFGLPHPAVADDSDIFGTNGTNLSPNVVFIIDNSGSMADDAPVNGYDRANTYPVLTRCDPVTTKKPKRTRLNPCASAAVFKGSDYEHYTNSIAGVTGRGSGPVQVALEDAGYWAGSINGSNVTLYTGNYVNYLLGRCANGGACNQQKMTIAKRVVTSVLDNVEGVRFGIMTFHYGSNGVRGARVVAEVGSSVTTMKANVNSLSPTGDTPLGDSLYDAGQYFKAETLTDGSHFASPIQLGCQPNYVIVITDGMQTSGTRSITAEATLRKTQDHSTSFSDVQRVIVHTVGFGLTINTSPATSDAAIANLKKAAENGGGTYFKSDSETDLQRALMQAVKHIKQATYTFATPVLPTTSTTGSTRAYLASFQSDLVAPFWRGYLKAYQRDSSGRVPVDSDSVPLQSAFIWDAGAALHGIPSASRTIYTEIGGSLSPFTKTNNAITTTLLGVATTALRDKVIDFVRGVDVNDENSINGTTDDRPWKLGDIFHSTPVLVSAPLLALNDSSYQMFKTAQASRTKVLIAGANDGMLHAFRETDGVELWAFVPPDMLGGLHSLINIAGAHDYYVDGSPIAVDIKVSGVWKTIVVFGCRRGGPYYYALDITDTTNPTFMWGFTDSKIQETWSEPAIGKVKLSGVDTYVAFFGGGYSTPQNNGFGKAFFAVDLATGTKLWEYYNAPGSTDDRQYMNFSLAANPTAVDTNNDGYVDHVYIGDVGGQVWRFDVSAASTSSWRGKRFFAADPGQANPPAAGEYSPGQAIYGAPALALDHRRNIWVFFGTGDRNQPNAHASNRFYGIKDNTDMTNGATLTESTTDVRDVTNTNVLASQGWYVLLQGRGEKVVAAPNVFNNSVFFSSFTPDSTVSCTGGGTAKLYALQVSSGYAAIDFSTGTAVAEPTSSTPRSKDVGHGITSMPVIVITPPATPGSAPASSVITATSNQELPSNPVPRPPFMKQVKSWRERIH